VGYSVTRNTPVLTPQVTPHKEDGADEAFDQFWQQYPNKVAKANALKAWKKIKPDDALLVKILASLTVAKDSDGWKKDEGKFIPHPATWLNGRRWEDEIEEAKAKNDFYVPPGKVYMGGRFVEAPKQ
jgi:hypothetical protein